MKLKVRIIIFLVIIFIIALGAYLFYREGTLPVDKSNKSTQIFVITPGQNLNDIANQLEKEHLIRNRVVFFLLVKQLGIEKKIQAGDFRLSPAMNLREIALNLTHGSLDRWITIIEGLRKEEIAQIISADLEIPESEFINSASEGYLFPDTYLVPTQATAEGVINILTSNFDKKYREAKSEINQKNNLTDQEVVILASLIEREARFDADRNQIANIMLRRIKEGHRLQIDATVQYALGYQAHEKTWWKKHTTFEDLKVDSPYNTYLYDGLPPGPISNPGIASIKAVLQATESTPYLFYISDQSGHLHFARNSEEHQRNIDKYLK